MPAPMLKGPLLQALLRRGPPSVSSGGGGQLRTPMPPFPPTLPQGSELLRDPSLGAQFRVHLVKMIILTQPEVGAEPEAQSHRSPTLPPAASCGATEPQGCRQGFQPARLSPNPSSARPSALPSLGFPVRHRGQKQSG